MLVGISVAFVGALSFSRHGGAAGRGRRCDRKVSCSAKRPRPLQEGLKDVDDQLIFTLQFDKPFGFRLAENPDGYGVGILEIAYDGGFSIGQHFKDMLADPSKPRIWAQEGDELIGVDGVSCDGSLDKAMELLAAAGDSPNLTFGRAKKGMIKVVFPGGLHSTSPRTQLLAQAAKEAGYDSGCICSDGSCGKCWHKDVSTGEIYVLPLNVPGFVPSVWRNAPLEDGRYVMGEEGQYESWIPLVLEPAPEAFKAETGRKAGVTEESQADDDTPPPGN